MPNTILSDRETIGRGDKTPLTLVEETGNNPKITQIHVKSYQGKCCKENTRGLTSCGCVIGMA